tara:strand:- start:671 stop:868 length:198 start_codon:yes stop_codon:yes gene_type:complete
MALTSDQITNLKSTYSGLDIKVEGEVVGSTTTPSGIVVCIYKGNTNPVADTEAAVTEFCTWVDDN